MATTPREQRQWWLFDPNWRTSGPGEPIVLRVVAERLPKGAVNVVDRAPGERREYVFWMVRERPFCIGPEGRNFFATEREAVEAAFAEVSRESFALSQQSSMSKEAFIAREKLAALSPLLERVRSGE